VNKTIIIQYVLFTRVAHSHLAHWAVIWLEAVADDKIAEVFLVAVVHKTARLGECMPGNSRVKLPETDINYVLLASHSLQQHFACGPTLVPSLEVVSCDTKALLPYFQIQRIVGWTCHRDSAICEITLVLVYLFWSLGKIMSSGNYLIFHFQGVLQMF